MLSTSYIRNRPRSLSKPTQDELKLLHHSLSGRSENELRHLIEIASNESPEIARVFMSIIADANLTSTTQSRVSQQQEQQQAAFHNTTYLDTGLLTPNEISADSEMSGIENVQPQCQLHHSTYFQHDSATTPSFFSQTPQPTGPASLSSSNSLIQRRSNKRKSLADRDDNIPTQESHSLSFSKKRRGGDWYSRSLAGNVAWGLNST